MNEQNLCRVKCISRDLKLLWIAWKVSSTYLEGNLYWVPLKKNGCEVCARIAHARVSEVGKESTPLGTPLQIVAGGWKHRGRTSCCDRTYKPGKNSLCGRRLKGKGKKVLGARETLRASEEGGKETPARRPLYFSFLTSGLLTRWMLKFWLVSLQNMSITALRKFKTVKVSLCLAKDLKNSFFLS